MNGKMKGNDVVVKLLFLMNVYEYNSGSKISAKYANLFKVVHTTIRNIQHLHIYG